jgi:hypothetical protein
MTGKTISVFKNFQSAGGVAEFLVVEVVDIFEISVESVEEAWRS